MVLDMANRENNIHMHQVNPVALLKRKMNKGVETTENGLSAFESCSRSIAQLEI